MAKPKRAAKISRAGPKTTPSRREQAAEDDPQTTAKDSQIAYSNLSLHDLFQEQARSMLDRVDLDDEQKQNILIAMSCPCCGAGGLSFTAKIKRRT